MCSHAHSHMRTLAKHICTNCLTATIVHAIYIDIDSVTITVTTVLYSAVDI